MLCSFNQLLEEMHNYTIRNHPRHTPSSCLYFSSSSVDTLDSVTTCASLCSFIFPAFTDERFYQAVIKELERNGWNVTAIDMGVPEKHEVKHRIINNALAGIEYPAIRINQTQNPDLIIAMQLCEVSIGYQGFRKDKSQEKKSETEVVTQQ